MHMQTFANNQALFRPPIMPSDTPSCPLLTNIPGKLCTLHRVQLALLQQHPQVDEQRRLLPRLGGRGLEAIQHLTGAQLAL